MAVSKFWCDGILVRKQSGMRWCFQRNIVLGVCTVHRLGCRLFNPNPNRNRFQTIKSEFHSYSYILSSMAKFYGPKNFENCSSTISVQSPGISSFSKIYSSSLIHVGKSVKFSEVYMWKCVLVAKYLGCRHFLLLIFPKCIGLFMTLRKVEWYGFHFRFCIL